MKLDNPVKRRLSEGQVQIGSWIQVLGVPAAARLMIASGLDYVNLDLEHSPYGFSAVSEMCAAALAAGGIAAVRPSSSTSHEIGRALDSGALAVYVPQVSSAAQAQDAVSRTRFPPSGTRGSQPPSVHTLYQRVEADAYMAAANEHVMVTVQIESAEGLANVDEIVAVNGVDVAVVGRGDLALDLGLGGHRVDRRIEEAVERVIDAAERHGKSAGLLVHSVDEAKEWVDRGARMVTYASEASFVRESIASATSVLRSHSASQEHA